MAQSLTIEVKTVGSERNLRNLTKWLDTAKVSINKLMKEAASTKMQKLRAQANHLSITIEKQNRVIKAQVAAQRQSIKAQQDAIKASKLHAATMLKQEKAAASAKERFLDFKEALKAAGADSQVLARVTRSFNSLETKMKKGDITTKEYTRTMIRFNAVLKQGQREVKKKADANRELEKRMKGASKGTEGLNRGMTDLTKSVQIALGPLSGVASRITAFSALLSTSNVIIAATAALFIGLGVVVFKSIKAFAQFEKQMFRINALVKATGGAAGITATELNSFARELSRATLTSAAKVRDAAGALMTFKSISGTVFKDTLVLAQDMAAVFGGDLRTSAVQLAKALEDPIAGLTSLRRIGVTFSDSQRSVIKEMTKTGEVAKAQGLILETLKKQIGGAGIAEGQGLAGAVDTLSDNWTEFLENLGRIDVIKDTVSALSGLLATLNKISEAAADPLVFRKVVGGEIVEQEELLSRLGTGRGTRAQRGIIEQRLIVLRSRMQESFAAEPSGPGDVLAQQQKKHIAPAPQDLIKAEESLEKQIEFFGVKNKKRLENLNLAKRLLGHESSITREVAKSVIELTKELELREATLSLSKASVKEDAKRGALLVDDLNAAIVMAKTFKKLEEDRAIAAKDAFAAATKEGNLKQLDLFTASIVTAVKMEEKIGKLEDKRLVTNENLISKIERENELLLMSTAERELQIELDKVKGDLTDKQMDRLQEAVKLQNAIKEAIKLQKEAAKAAERTWKKAADGIQSALKGAFRSALDESEFTFRSFAEKMISLMKDMAAEIAAALIFKPIIGGVLGAFGAPASVSGAGGQANGLLGSIGQSLIGEGFKTALKRAFPGFFGGGATSAVGSIGALGTGAALGGGLTLSSAAAATAYGGGIAGVAGIGGAVGTGGLLNGGFAGPLGLGALLIGGSFLGSSLLGGGGKVPRAGARIAFNEQGAFVSDKGGTGGGDVGRMVAETQKVVDILNEILKLNPGALLSSTGVRDIQATTRSEGGAITRSAGELLRDILQVGILRGVDQSVIDEFLKTGNLDVFGLKLEKTGEELDAFAKSLKESFQFASSAAKAFGSAALELTNIADSLRVNPSLSPLSPLNRLTEARGQFTSLQVAALGGDLNAMKNLGSAAQVLIEASREYFASSAGFQQDFNLVQEALRETAGRAGTLSDTAAVQTALLEAQTTLLEEIKINLASPEGPNADLLKEQLASMELNRELLGNIGSLLASNATSEALRDNLAIVESRTGINELTASLAASLVTGIQAMIEASKAGGALPTDAIEALSGIAERLSSQAAIASVPSGGSGGGTGRSNVVPFLDTGLPEEFLGPAGRSARLASRGAVPGFARGAIVSSPTLAMIGEGAGAEAVVPLNARVLSVRDEALVEETSSMRRQVAVLIDRIGQLEETLVEELGEAHRPEAPAAVGGR